MLGEDAAHLTELLGHGGSGSRLARLDVGVPILGGEPPNDVGHRRVRFVGGCEQDRPQQCLSLARPVVRVRHAIGRGSVEQRKRDLDRSRHRSSRIQRRPPDSRHSTRQFGDGPHRIEDVDLAELEPTGDRLVEEIVLDRREDGRAVPVEDARDDGCRLARLARTDHHDRASPTARRLAPSPRRAGRRRAGCSVAIRRPANFPKMNRPGTTPSTKSGSMSEPLGQPSSHSYAQSFPSMRTDAQRAESHPRPSQGQVARRSPRERWRASRRPHPAAGAVPTPATPWQGHRRWRGAGASPRARRRSWLGAIAHSSRTLRAALRPRCPARDRRRGSLLPIINSSPPTGFEAVRSFMPLLPPSWTDDLRLGAAAEPPIAERYRATVRAPR